MSRTEGSRHREEAMSAAQYYRRLHIPERVEEALNTGYRLNPPDLPGYLSNYFAELSNPPVISNIHGRRILSGAGNAALEVEVFCTVRNNDKKICSAVISVDSAPPLTCDTAEAQEKERAMSVETAIEWIRESIGPMLRGIQPNEQSNIDQLLSDFFQPKMEESRRQRESELHAAASSTRSVPSPPASPAASKKKGSGKGKKAASAEKPIPPAEPPEPIVIGSLAVSAVSLAVATSSAILREVPLYSYISALRHNELPSKMAIPTPLITLLSYGKCSPGKLNLMKEVMMVPRPGLTAQQAVDLALSLQAQITKQMDAVGKNAQSGTKSVSALGCLVLAGDRIDQPLDLLREACEQLGLELGTDIYLAINCAAHELMDYNKGKYEIISGTWKSPEEMVDIYVDIISRHPAVIAFVDPLRMEDVAQWETLGKTVGSRCYLIADVASRTKPNLPCGDPIRTSGAILKYTNQTTITDLLTEVRLMEEEKRVIVLGCPHEECSGSSVADLTVAIGAQFIKLGGLLRGERTAKYNRLLAIEEELVQSGMLDSYSAFDFPVIWSESQNSEENRPST